MTGANPATATRDTTLDIQISGSGFDRGSRVEFGIDGVVEPKLRVNSTSYSKSSLLVANVTVAVDAPIASYDVLVTTAGGKKGIGSELLAVLEQYDLGTLGGDGAAARAISPSGIIAGNAAASDGRLLPFIWTSAVGMTPLPTEPTWESGIAYAVNDLGRAAGTADIDPGSTIALRAVGWTNESGAWAYSILPRPSRYDGSSYAYAMNASGIIVGGVRSADGSSSALVQWNPGLEPVSLIEWVRDGSLAGYQANGINAGGWVAGYYGGPAGGVPQIVHQAFVRIPDATGDTGAGYMVMLPRYGTGGNFANDIADDGTVVGYSSVPKKGSGFTATALRWRLRVPGTRPASGNDYIVETLGPGYALSINGRGDIAGTLDNSAVWWPNGSGVAQLARCCDANAINDDRQIVGRGGLTGAYGRAMLWRP